MKKRLFLLPLIGGFLLSGCDFSLESLMFWKKSESQQQEESKDDKSGEDPAPEEHGEEGEEGSDTAFKGLTITVESLSEAGLSKSYASAAEISELDGITTEISNVCLNELNSKSLPVWVTPDDVGVPVIQFKKSEGKFAVKGKISKLTLKFYSSYDFGATQIPQVTFNDKAVSKPTVATQTEDTEYQKQGTKENFDIKLYTCVYNVNADAVHKLEISDTYSYALYFHSFILE